MPRSQGLPGLPRAAGFVKLSFWHCALPTTQFRHIESSFFSLALIVAILDCESSSYLSGHKTLQSSDRRSQIIDMDPNTFHQLPLQFDHSSKEVAATNSSVQGLNAELELLNDLHRNILQLETPTGVPPPPVPVNPKRSAQITKLRESGTAAFKKQQYQEAIKNYTEAIEMAYDRPKWEPTGLAREELATLHGIRAQAHMALQEWPQGAIDAETSVELKRAGNTKAWWRRGRSLYEMGRLSEARDCVKTALELDANDSDLQALKKEIDESLAKKSS